VFSTPGGITVDQLRALDLEGWTTNNLGACAGCGELLQLNDRQWAELSACLWCVQCEHAVEVLCHARLRWGSSGAVMRPAVMMMMMMVVVV
jgi:hypothetical protein